MSTSMCSFLILVQPKNLAIGQDHRPHKANEAQQLQEELQTMLQPLAQHANDVAVVTLEGGTMAAVSSKEQEEVVSATVGDRIAVFQGQLRNLQKLAAKYGPHAAARPMSPVEVSCASSLNGDAHSDKTGDEDASASLTHTHIDGHSVNAAELVLHMYEALGVALLAQLVGKFSLCMYDAKQMRVLAARDGSGAVPLIQARTARDSLAISTNPMLLACCHDTLEFQPGFFKYGWHAEPRLFTPQDAVPVRRSIDQGYSGSRRTSMDSHHGSRRTSMDVAHQQPGSYNSWRRTSVDNAHLQPGNHNSGHRTSMDTQHNARSISMDIASGGQQADGSRRSMDGSKGGGRAHGHGVFSPPHLPTLEEQEEHKSKGGARKRHPHGEHAGGQHGHGNGGHHGSGNGGHQAHGNGGHKSGHAGAAKGPGAGKGSARAASGPAKAAAAAAQQAAHALSHLNVNAPVFVPGGATVA